MSPNEQDSLVASPLEPSEANDSEQGSTRERAFAARRRAPRIIADSAPAQEEAGKVGTEKAASVEVWRHVHLRYRMSPRPSFRMSIPCALLLTQTPVTF